MRKRFEQQQQLGLLAIADVEIPLKSRHELPAILAGLQHVFCDPELNAEAFGLIESCLYGEDQGRQGQGRPGLDLWEILVLGIVRLGTDSDWDALQHMANYDQLLRGILGVHGTRFGSKTKEYKRQTLVDTVSLLDEETLAGINSLVVGKAHQILKKKIKALK